MGSMPPEDPVGCKGRPPGSAAIRIGSARIEECVHGAADDPWPHPGLDREDPGGGDVAINATVCNGHDMLLLARGVGPTVRVFGFDVQPEALEAMRRRLREARVEACPLRGSALPGISS
jgi:ubiquinone/menaquinone biosynthesis C-methylase UbiE